MVLTKLKVLTLNSKRIICGRYALCTIKRNPFLCDIFEFLLFEIVNETLYRCNLSTLSDKESLYLWSISKKRRRLAVIYTKSTGAEQVNNFHSTCPESSFNYPAYASAHGNYRHLHTDIFWSATFLLGFPDEWCLYYCLGGVQSKSLWEVGSSEPQHPKGHRRPKYAQLSLSVMYVVPISSAYVTSRRPPTLQPGFLLTVTTPCMRNYLRQGHTPPPSLKDCSLS